MKRKHVLNQTKGIVFTLLWTFSLCVFSQNLTVKGSVKDERGEPLIGATLQVQGTSRDTVTVLEYK